MAVRELRKLGDPVLRRQARKVEKIDAGVRILLADMAETMAHYRGIGLAAPQVGVDLAVVVVKLGDEFPLLELINPEIVQCWGEDVDVEGCLSVPGVYGEVKRYADVKVSFQDARGDSRQLAASGLLARALQHELDHLQGVIFVDKVIRYVDGDERQ